METAKIIPNIIKDFQSNDMELLMVCKLKIIFKNSITDVARTRLVIAGRIPFSVACTPANLKNFFNKAAINMMIINDGRTTPMVATNAPKKPPLDEPIKVAIFTAIGPGELSATAIKLINSSSVSHVFDKTSSRISDIIPYPPPNERAPIFKKTRNNLR